MTLPSGPASFPRAFGDYELLGELARGGMGIVYRARQVMLERTVALKVILSAHLASPDFVERFRVEARSAASLDHPNIVPIYEIGEHAGEPFFSMKLVEGETLAGRIGREWNPQCEKPSVPRLRAFVELIAALARAVHYAHQRGVLHRDVKPNNVLLGPDDTPYLTDFGLAKLVEADSGMTRTSAVLGTPSYMSPEQARGETRAISTASDVYGLGAVLYELLAGQPPFVGGTSVETIRRVLDQEPRPPARLNPALDRDLETICLKCLEKDPSARYASAEALAEDLERWLRHETIVARPATPTEKFRKWVRRRPGAATAAASLILALVVVTGVSSVAAFRLNKARQSAEQANIRLEQHVRDLEWQKAEELAETGKVGEALAHLARLVRTSPDPSAPAARLVSMLSLRSFPLPQGGPLRHERGVSDLDYAPSGDLLATASHDGTVGLWNVHDQRLIASLKHPAPVLAVKFHPGGGHVLSVGRNGEAWLWDVKDCSIRHRFPSTELNHPVIEFSAGGEYLAQRTSLHEFTVFHTASGDAVFGPVECEGGLQWLTFNHAGNVLMAAAADGSVRLFEVPSGRAVEPSIRLSKRAAFALFTPDERKIVLGESGGFSIWDRQTGQLQREIKTGHNEVIRMVISPDGQRVLTVPYLESPRLWEVASGKPMSEPLAALRNVSEAAFSPDGLRMATASVDGRAHVWDGRNGALLLQPMQHSGPITRVRFSPNGHLIATSSDDGTAQIWDIRMRPPEHRRVAGSPSLREALLSLDGKWLFTSDGPVVQRRSAATGAPDGAPMRHQKTVFMGALSPDGVLLAVLAGDAAHLWDTATCREITPPLLHEDQLTDVVFSPDGRFVVTTASDRTARVWETASGKPRSQPLAHPDIPLNVDFHPSGERFITGGLDGRVRAWSVPEGRLLFESDAHEGRIWTVRSSPDGRFVASASADRNARLWDAATGKALTSIPHNRAVLTLCFSPDSKRLVTATEDGSVRVWDVPTGDPVSQNMRHSGITWNAEFSPDGKRVLTGAFDATARLWDAASGYPISEPLRHAGDVLRARFARDGARIMTTATDGVLRFWETPLASGAVPGWLPDFAEAVAGKRFSKRGELESVPATELQDLKQQRMAVSQQDGYYERWARWFLDDRLHGAGAEFRR